MQSMQILSTPGWSEYELLDSGDGYRLERFGKYILKRPDPQIIWKPMLSNAEWEKADAVFERVDGKEKWVRKTAVPERWLMEYDKLSFFAKLSPFKHTGVFPEQTLQWDFIREQIASSQKLPTPNSVKILNLFAYTGIASLVAAKAGAHVTHVDASKPTMSWARENQQASGLIDQPIRWILDDALKFVQREIKRESYYDGIIMDPPVYGHGPTGEIWDFPKSFPHLLELCRQVLSQQPRFILINAYAISASSLMLENVLKDLTKDLGGTIEVGELALQEKSGGRLLSTGIFGRWSR